MAGFNSTPRANNGSSRPSLRVNTTFTTTQLGPKALSSSPLPPCSSPVSPMPTTGRRLLSHSKVGDIWNAHIDSLTTLMNSVPESRWVGGSPILQESGYSYDIPTNQVLQKMMGDNVTHLAYDTPDQSPSEDEMDLDEIIDLYQSGQGSPSKTNEAHVNGTLIQPYGLPADAPTPDPHASHCARQVLDNSGVSIMTYYPLSTSPRMSTSEVHRNLNSQETWKRTSLLP